MNKKIIALTDKEITALKAGYKKDKSATFRERCHIIILNNQGKTAPEIATIMNISHSKVYTWLTRYKKDGIEGLRTKKGQGRKSIIKSEDYGIIKQAVQEERQRLKVVHEELQNSLGKKFSQKTLKRILKNLAVDINE